MKRTLLKFLTLVAPVVLTLAMGLAGCGDDHRYNNRERAEDRREDRRDRAEDRRDREERPKVIIEERH